MYLNIGIQLRKLFKETLPNRPGVKIAHALLEMRG